jgi:hypothetical protein
MTISRIPSVEGGIQPTLLTAKGDLISATAASTVARLAVGSDAQILVADSSTSTGLKWATPASGSTAKGVSVYNTAAQGTASATWTAITWDSEDFDTDAFHSTSTNTSRLTVPAGMAGKYSIKAQLEWNVNATGFRALRIYKNGTVIKQSTEAVPHASIYVGLVMGTDLTLAVNDYIELFAWQNVGTTMNAYPTQLDSQFSMMYWGA